MTYWSLLPIPNKPKNRRVLHFHQIMSDEDEITETIPVVDAEGNSHDIIVWTQMMVRPQNRGRVEGPKRFCLHEGGGAVKQLSDTEFEEVATGKILKRAY